MAKNPCGKTVTRENAYEVWQSFDGTWTWFCLKKYQTPEAEAKNSYARWFCNVVTPFTSERGDTGDVYVKKIKSQAIKLDYNPLTQPKKKAQSQVEADPEPMVILDLTDTTNDPDLQ